MDEDDCPERIRGIYACLFQVADEELLILKRLTEQLERAIELQPEE